MSDYGLFESLCDACSQSERLLGECHVSVYIKQPDGRIFRYGITDDDVTESWLIDKIWLVIYDNDKDWNVLADTSI